MCNNFLSAATSKFVHRIILSQGLNEILGATHAIEGSAYWIALVVSWMQTLGSQPDMHAQNLPDHWD
jgi:hypothetical protein